MPSGSRASMLAAVGVAALGGAGGASGGSAPDPMLVITLHGHASAQLARREAGGAARYREAGTYTVVWRVRESELASGRSFDSSSATVTGTSGAVRASSSCSGSLTADRKPVVLTVTGDEAFATAPNPFATAVSPACPQGLTAGRWRLAAPGPGASRQQQLRYAAREKAWRVYEDPGFAFRGPTFTPVAKGGNSEGFGLGFGPGGSFTWVAVLTVEVAPNG